jgi:hypothetical protein
VTSTPLTDQQLDDIDARAQAATAGPWTVSEDYSDVLGPDGDHLASYWNPTSETRNGEFIAHARQDVPALLAEIRRLKGQRKYLIGQLAKRDAESGRGDEAVRQFLAEEQPAVEESEACGKCKQPFDPADTRFDGRARYHLTPYCRACVDRCHDTEIADHRCVICA